MKLLTAREMTWDALREEAQRGSLFLLPIGPLEDHASHLPSGTDPIICEAMANRTAQLLNPVKAVEAARGSTHVVMLPTLQQGSSFLKSLGCLRLKTNTLTQVLVEYGIELDKIGVRRLVLLTSHGALDHMKAIEKAARRIEIKTRIRVCAPSNRLLHDFLEGKHNEAVQEKLGRRFTEEEAAGLSGDVHAAAWETSLLLHIAPRLVEKTYINLPPHDIFKNGRLVLRALKTHRGYFGSPGLASAELGKAAFEAMAEASAAKIQEFCRQPIRHETPKPSRRSQTAKGLALGFALGWAFFKWLERPDSRPSDESRAFH